MEDVRAIGRDLRSVHTTLLARAISVSEQILLVIRDSQRHV
jgi:hypothetical protein